MYIILISQYLTKKCIKNELWSISTALFVVHLKFVCSVIFKELNNSLFDQLNIQQNIHILKIHVAQI